VLLQFEESVHVSASLHIMKNRTGKFRFPIPFWQEKTSLKSLTLTSKFVQHRPDDPPEKSLNWKIDGTF
jgi:hypothetical protein